ncbi:tRNA processing endoribonuclease Trz1 [Ophiocordyceps camponoti-floridani]|uniref:tRNA processing endoribonuclease Trz1 n=1 Tax=Ophiocordyceps camponoti-floridani TaxID=2030778 RepID=A0A8H4Q504_9HYPO|nr:tRNA processing endoribonuclease Trz1 [Ophiocordyceps camponoti-floridani]
MTFSLEASSYDETGFQRLSYIRAFAAAYYLNTIVFTTNKRADMLMSTAHVDTYCRALDSAAEFASDDYLVRLVRLQQLAQGIVVAVAPGTTMQCHLTVAQVLILDSAMTQEHLTQPQRLSLLWTCVHTLRPFLSLNLPTLEHDRPNYLPIMVSDLTYAFITGIKLLTLQLPGWDATRVGAELGLDAMLGRQVGHLGGLIERRAVGGEAGGLEDPLERLLRLLVTGRELVALQVAGVPMGEIADVVVGEMGGRVEGLSLFG